MLSNECLILTVSSVVAFLMALGIGANDVSNSVGTAVGAKAISIRQALVIALVFESLGAVFAGSEVSATIAERLFSPEAFTLKQTEIILIMLASLIAAGSWLMIATYAAWPVSTTHTLLGALITLGFFVLGPSMISWKKVSSVALAWILSPLLGGVTSFILFKIIQLGILHQQNRSKRFVVYLAIPFLMINMILAFTMVNFITTSFKIKIAAHWMLIIPLEVSLLCLVCFGIFFYKRYKRIIFDRIVDPQRLDKAFNSLTVVTACCMAYAHGSNDIANAIGPLVAINQLLFHVSVDAVPLWILSIGIGGMSFGLIIWGHRVIETIGTNITELTSSKGFSASLATAFTVLLASHLGYPISTTHTLVGAILGIGFARGIESLNLETIKMILLSWIVTFPAGGLIAGIFYSFLKLTLSFTLV